MTFFIKEPFCNPKYATINLRILIFSIKPLSVLNYWLSLSKIVGHVTM